MTENNERFVKEELSEQSTQQTYEFGSEKTQNISMDLLSKSIRHEGKHGRELETKPVQVWTLMLLIMEMLEQNEINYIQDPIHVQNRSSNTYLSDADKAIGYTRTLAPIEKWKFDKVINLIQLPNIYEDQNEGIVYARNAVIGVTLNDYGLNVAFGMNVHECVNFNVYGGTILRTYCQGGNQGMNWDSMKIKMKSWIRNLNQIWTVQNDIMKTMQGFELPKNYPVIQEVIGDLYVKALRAAYYKGEITPFNTHELSDFTQKIIKANRDQDQLGTVWDLYNWGTSIMKPGQMDIGEIAANSNLWAGYLSNRFELDIPEAIIVEDE